MNILVAGGTGFIGQNLTQSLIQKGHHVYILTRKANMSSQSPYVHYITWLSQDDNIPQQLPTIDAAINLSGDPLNKGRWTQKKKDEIINSRKITTQHIFQLLKDFNPKPSVLINASAVGVYGNSNTDTFTEESVSLRNSFPSQVCEIWENEALQAESLGVRTVLARIGVVLSNQGGALPKMTMPYRLFIGGKVASGEQWVSWIHIHDLVELFQFAIHNQSIKGPINFTAPNPVQMNELGRQIGNALNRPHWFPVPTIMLRTIFGEMSEFLSEGQKVIPKKAVDQGYSFTYPHCDQALKSILR
ncbi:TIGR01777 family oxidoreductase [Salinibacillus xinjiangensis]|uniref:TIGR01777 family protein n=1 Tax=Salinibacillus xinjiangensis TaxID=1229268 RepID=A0A6G1X2Z7_9BACI|nr:TIGR01777 family oxidoreductase [Salinibacillus xinjiangensis]MRG85324.1 TIGR01777 family protein [Salinibacillus xinjiangensis]